MTRAEAIVRLERWMGSAKKQVNDFEAVFRGSTSSWRGDVECFEMAIAALKEQDVTDINVGCQWIRVEDRLPEKHTIVLCYKDGQRRLGYYIGAEYSKGVAAFRHPKDQFAFGVTHWMPLPTPPKEDAE